MQVRESAREREHGREQARERASTGETEGGGETFTFYIIDAPLCKRVRVLLEMAQRPGRPSTMTRYVANAGVQPKLDAKVVQVVDHRHHAVWEEAWERDELARGVVSAWMPAIVEDNVILHTEYRIQNMAVVGLDRGGLVGSIVHRDSDPHHSTVQAVVQCGSLTYPRSFIPDLTSVSAIARI